MIYFDKPEHITSWMVGLAINPASISQCDSANAERTQGMLIIHTGLVALSDVVRSETAEPQPNRSHTTAVAFWSHVLSGMTGLHSPLTAISSIPAQRLFSPLNLTLSETGNQ